MKIRSLQIYSLNIPFKVTFKHNSAERATTQSILVSTQTFKNNIGLGESCPREYVTKESVQSCFAFFQKHQKDILNTIHSLDELKKWMFVNKEEINKNPSAWCAIELSLLDAMSKDRSESVEKTIGAPELGGSFQYSAILGDSSIETFEAQVQQYKNFGFIDFKIKISGNIETDNEKFKTLSSVIPEAKIRLDANNIWQKAKDVLHYSKSINIEPLAIEEPLQPMDFEELNRLARQSQFRVVLDESFYNEEHFDLLGSSKGKVLINLRISKMGGILRARKIAKKAIEENIPLIIGAQVGETSILTRAALTLANENRKNVHAQEGAYGTLLLETDITNNPIMFKENGVLFALSSVDSKKYGFQIKYELRDGILQEFCERH